jgi:hypothetical protein
MRCHQQHYTRRHARSHDSSRRNLPPVGAVLALLVLALLFRVADLCVRHPQHEFMINTLLPALPGKRTLSSARLECGRVRKSPCLQQDLAAFPVLGSFGSRSESAPRWRNRRCDGGRLQSLAAVGVPHRSGRRTPRRDRRRIEPGATPSTSGEAIQRAPHVRGSHSPRRRVFLARAVWLGAAFA